MISEEKIIATIKTLFDTIEFTKEPAGLYDPLRYMISIGGKRIRPRLCLTTYALYKDDITEEILQPAAALEVFHSFTLIHDDIMDKSPMRRGVPTVWTKWKEDTAILSGDVMSIDSYKRIAKAPKDVLPEALELFSTTAAQVCDGQQYDMDFENVPEVPMSEYMNMIGLKTGVLIACASKMGGLIAGASKEDCENLYNYGYYLGLAFQVADDHLDAYGDEKVFGKPIGGDIVNNKKCWLTTHALEKASAEQRKKIFNILDWAVGTTPQKVAKVEAMKAIYDQLDVKNDAVAEIEALSNKAIEYAKKLNVEPEGIQMLVDFANKLVGRNK